MAGTKANKKTAPLIINRIVAAPHSAKTAGVHGRRLKYNANNTAVPGNVKTIEFPSKDGFAKSHSGL
jgi:hypothetical protein